MADDAINQNEIDALLKQAAGDAAKAAPSASHGGAPGPDESQALSQSDIQALMAAAQQGQTKAPPVQRSAPATPPHAAVVSAGMEAPIAADDIELLLSHAERALASAQQAGSGELPAGMSAFKFDDFSGAPPSTEAATIELIRDVELDLKIELGRTQMYLEDVLKLRKGSVVPLEKLAGDPVDIYVNGRLIARGEVLVLNDNFCVRVAELISSEPSAVG
jgi:flagellar motor switch protein FliN/FliY